MRWKFEKLKKFIIIFLLILPNISYAGVDFSNLGKARDPVREYQLMNGAVLKTRLPRRYYDFVVEAGLPQTVLKYDMDWNIGLYFMDEEYIITHTGLDWVQKNLNVDLFEEIQKRRVNGNIVRVLDWGMGAGQTLLDLRRKLDQEGMIDVELYGFGHTIFGSWGVLPEGILLVLDEGDLIEDYFSEEYFDIIYSHFGVIHVNPAFQKEYLKRLARLLKVDGDMFFNLSDDPAAMDNNTGSVIVTSSIPILQK